MAARQRNDSQSYRDSVDFEDDDDEEAFSKQSDEDSECHDDEARKKGAKRSNKNNGSTAKKPPTKRFLETATHRSSSSPLVLDPDDECDKDAANESAKTPARNHTPRSNNRPRPPRPSELRPRSGWMPAGAASNSRQRRRSSARFLSFADTDGGRSSHQQALDRSALREIYKNALRYNRENRINATLSWNLPFIENMRAFIRDDESDDEDGYGRRSSVNPSGESSAADSSIGRINFTKASCTLDASAKIYSHRVDDVHLSSYKVLNNLHRSEGNQRQNKKGSQSDTTSTTRKAPKAPGSTLETNLANINVNALDSAFDIDPLFHKMSKNFDEGGAKGLLLANLATGKHGCSIVFDSNENSTNEEQPPLLGRSEGPLDVSALKHMFSTSLEGRTLESLPFVPQLASLRADLSKLESEGFSVEPEPSMTRNRAYAAEPQAEREAEEMIHQEALEQSQSHPSTSRRSVFHDPEDENVPPFEHDNGHDEQMSDDPADYAPDDFGMGGTDDDAFDDFIAVANEGSNHEWNSVAVGEQPGDAPSQSQTSMLLDAVASGKLLGMSDYEFLDTKALTNLANNGWAGAAHWKPMRRTHRVRPKSILTEEPRRRAGKQRQFIDLRNLPDMTDILRKPPRSRSKKVGNVLQLSQSTIDKLSQNDNLLPPDAGITVKSLQALFSRPEDTYESILKMRAQPSPTTSDGSKAVGFNLDQVETFGDGRWDDGSVGGGFGDDDFGPGGFSLATPRNGDDEDDEENQAGYMLDDLEGVRRVEKVQIKYATVAKKVDVKRLKKEMWEELESQFQENTCAESEEPCGTPKASSPPTQGVAHFAGLVRDMEANKTQQDVSLAFYFLSILHLANEKGLRLESQGLHDFSIRPVGDLE